ncbi:hypothetical protein AG1IA_09918 [Rhizoctonia solani AG-1 IA]|uniref:Uncharacterized protein n=1 Tax=Thanatephorus cucumeris (strain AG1-IA) TaxID=983506 RepID=L8WH43_THACA|nr:hypothetical protein AG1IA_09918 [Rhizoctonia solani AG-1 IA]
MAVEVAVFLGLHDGFSRVSRLIGVVGESGQRGLIASELCACSRLTPKTLTYQRQKEKSRTVKTMTGSRYYSALSKWRRRGGGRERAAIIAQLFKCCDLMDSRSSENHAQWIFIAGITGVHLAPTIRTNRGCVTLSSLCLGANLAGLQDSWKAYAIFKMTSGIQGLPGYPSPDIRGPVQPSIRWTIPGNRQT